MMASGAYRLKSWTDVVKPHDDIVGGRLEMSTYAADIGAVDRLDPHVPKVYQDAREFYRTTYMTRNLKALLTDVVDVVNGGAGDRVIQLRTPFGGGKTHALLALFHLIKNREAIDPRTLGGIPSPGRGGRVAVLSGLDLDPFAARDVEGLQIRTLWGELAFRLGGQAGYQRVSRHDEEGAPPGNDVLRPLLASGPVLLLLDEVLVYVQRAGGRDGTHPFRKQVMNFLQGLTELVRGLPNVAMVYSLQASEHEAAGDQALLTDLDHLVARVDAKREPVSDEEVVRVVQRRLFPTFGDDPQHHQVALEAAREYALAYGRLREGFAETAAERRAVRADAERFEERVALAYPFHPELLDLMYHRWGSLPSYQRTRGALQFLASVVHAIWNGARHPQALIGPGDVALEDEAVRGAFFSQVGERERFSSVLAADISGDGARCRDVDRRIASDSPALEHQRVGTRTATAIMLFSFGGRQGEDRGVVESDLLESLVSPDLDRNVVTAALHDLREELLYLHHAGRRYRFEPKANLNLLIAQERKRFQPDEVVSRVRDAVLEMLRHAPRDEALIWPPDGGAIPDGVPSFRLVYLGEEWSTKDEADRDRGVIALVERCRAARREYQNSLAFAVPGAEALDRARIAARNMLAISSLLGQSQQFELDREQLDELKERLRGSGADLSAATDRLYELVLVPVAERSGEAPFRLEAVDLRAQLAGGRGVHDRMLDALRKHVFDAVMPSRIVTLTRLGDEREFVACDELVKWFFSYFDFPKLRGAGALSEAIARGTAETFGYLPSGEVRDGVLVARRENSLQFGVAVAADEVDLGGGAYLVSAGLAKEMRGTSEDVENTPDDGSERADDGGRGDTTGSEERGAVPLTRLRLHASVSAAQLFRILPALQNLADRSSEFAAKVEVEVRARESFDRAWIRNAVEEHLDEAGVHGQIELE